MREARSRFGEDYKSAGAIIKTNTGVVSSQTELVPALAGNFPVMDKIIVTNVGTSNNGYVQVYANEEDDQKVTPRIPVKTEDINGIFGAPFKGLLGKNLSYKSTIDGDHDIWVRYHYEAEQATMV